MSHNFSEKTGLLGRIHGNFESCSYFVTIVEKSKEGKIRQIEKDFHK